MSEGNENKKLIDEYNRQLSWVRSLPEKDVNFLCDGGWYNDAMKGYMIRACHIAGYDYDQTSELLRALRLALSEINCSEARKEYMDF